TALAVEGRLVEQQLDGVADLGRLHPRSVLDDREGDALALIARVAGEFGRAILFGEVEPNVLARLGAGTLPRSPGLSLLLGHGGVESGLIDPEPLIDQRLLGEVERETVGVVELERRLARQRAALGQAGGRFVEQLETGRERLAEAGL